MSPRSQCRGESSVILPPCSESLRGHLWTTPPPHRSHHLRVVHPRGANQLCLHRECLPSRGRHHHTLPGRDMAGKSFAMPKYVNMASSHQHVCVSIGVNMPHSVHNKVLRLLLNSQFCVTIIGHCLDSGNIRNGIRILNGTREGDVVSFRCLDGHGLLGFRQLVCGPDGEWNGIWPRCFKGTILFYHTYCQSSLLGVEIHSFCMKINIFKHR